MSDLAASLLSTSRRLWPFGLILGLCGITFFIGEHYPLTRFPMYSGFPDHTYYLYVGDKNGDPDPDQRPDRDQHQQTEEAVRQRDQKNR